MSLVTCPKCRKMGYLRSRKTGNSYFPIVSNHYPNDFVKYKKLNREIPLSTEKEVFDHYQELDTSNKNAAVQNFWRIIISMHYKTTRVYEFKEQRIGDSRTKPYEYSYICTYDPGGKKLAHVHIHKEAKPINYKKWVFQVLGPKSRYYYVSHYDSKKYRQGMKKYKEGKMKARPNGNKRCNLGRSLPYNIKIF